MGSYNYSFHVKVVGIVEIVLQTLTTLLMLVEIGVLVFGVSMVSSYNSNLGTIGENGGTFNQGGVTIGISNSDRENVQKAAASAISAFMIASLVILVVVNIVGAWLVYLVFTGGQKENASRLSLWYIIQCVLFSIGLILMIITMIAGFEWYMIIISLLYIGYRVYSIHVVRCHAAEIRENSNRPFKH